MPRITPLKVEDLPANIQALCAERAKAVGKNHNAMLTFARIPEIVEPLYALLDRLVVDRHNKSLLDKRLRHLLLLRVPRLNGCRYCTGHQTARRAEQGYSMEESDALLEAPLDSPLFNDREKAALRFVEEVTKDVSPSLAAFAEVRKYYNADQIVELSAIAGIWCM